MLNVPYFNVSSEEHRARTQAHLISGEYLKQSIESLRLSELAKLNVQMQLPDAICMAANPKWADRKFGAVNTIWSMLSVRVWDPINTGMWNESPVSACSNG